MSGKRILLIEDNSEMRDFIANVILREAGYLVETASDGLEGLQLALDKSPDLIVTDNQLPSMNGVDIVVKLREEDYYVPIILITAEGSEEVILKALRVGISDYLTKPFEPSMLLAAVERLLSDYPTYPPPSIESDDDSEVLFSVVSLFEQMQTAIIVVDKQGVIRVCNQAAKMFFKESAIEQIIGSRLDDSIPHPILIEMLSPTNPISPAHGELKVEDQIFQLRTSSIKDVGRMIVFQDVTHLKEISRIKGEQVTAISHDIRSPLTALLSYIDLIPRMGEFNDKQRQFTEQASQSIKTITELVDDLLALETLETGLARHSESVQVEKLLKNTIEILQAKSLQKKQTLLCTAEPELPPVWGVPSRLRQAFTNLLDNAIKYTPAEGKIKINIEVDSDQVIIHISDTGVGIPSEDQDAIFDRFYRAGSVSESHEGRGIGLSTVKSVVEEHNGRIWVESTPGTGTTFIVMLPAYRKDQIKDK